MDWVTTTQVLEDLKESNDILAWNSFRNNFYPVIFNFAKTLGLSATDAEDATQETMLAFLKAFRNRITKSTNCSGGAFANAINDSLILTTILEQLK